MPRSSSPRCTACLILLISMLAGCGSDHQVSSVDAVSPRSNAAGVSATDRQAGTFFPLEVGNRWHYFGRAHDVIIGSDGGVLSEPDTLLIENDQTDEMVRKEWLAGLEYVLERSTLRQRTWLPHGGVFGAGHDFIFYVHYREDRTGLYEAYVVSSALAASPERGARKSSADGSGRLEAMNQVRAKRALIEGALHGIARPPALSITRASQDSIYVQTRLSYPLRPGRQWDVLNNGDLISRVEGQDVVEVPAGRFPAWRISLCWPDLFGPNDRALVWYGRSGLIRTLIHLESTWTDEFGNVIGRDVWDEYSDLIELDLAGQ